MKSADNMFDKHRSSLCADLGEGIKYLKYNVNFLYPKNTDKIGYVKTLSATHALC